MIKQKQYLRAILALGAANIIWGITPAFNKLGLRDFTPLWFFVTRYSLAILFCLVIFKQHGRKIKKKDHIKVAASAWVGISLTIVLMYYGLRITQAIDAAIIGALGPIILFWLSIIFLKERFKLQPLIGTLIAFAGSLIIILGPLANSRTGNSFTYFLGGCLVFCSIFVDQVGAIITQPLLKKYDMSRLALWRLLYAVPPVLILAIILEPVPTFRVNPITIISLLYLSFLGITVAFSLYYFGARRLKVEYFSVLFYIDPVFGVLSSMLILGEKPNLGFLTGVICILVGIIVAEVHIKTKLKLPVMRFPRH